MGLLERLWQDIAQRELEVFALVLPRLVPEHRDDAADSVLPGVSLVAKAAVEGVELRDVGTFANPEFDAPTAEQVERAYSLRYSRRVVCRQLDDPVSQTDLLRPLARGGEEHFRGGGVGVLLEEVVLDLPGVVVAEPVGQLDLRQRVLEEIVLTALRPWPWELVLVEYPEPHCVPPSVSVA
jgi:hypothetical protein